jgi:hypothetical protein
MREDELRVWAARLASTELIEVLNAIFACAGSKLPEALALLETAGSGLSQPDRERVLTLEDRTFTIEQLAHEESERLRASIPAGAVAPTRNQTSVFVSYSTNDRDRAVELAGALADEGESDVFIDRWELRSNDRLAGRIREAVDRSSIVIVLLSEHSAASTWVQTEVSQALEAAASGQGPCIVLVRLDSSPIPEALSDVIHIDWRDRTRRYNVIQEITDAISGRESFNIRVGNLLRDHTDRSQNAIVARRVLADLAPGDLVQIERNQQWLCWELTVAFLPHYPVSIIVGPHGSGGAKLELIDRWFRTRNSLTLDEGSLSGGLWHASVDLRVSRTANESGQHFLGELGRLSYRRQSSYGVNPIVPTDDDAMVAVRDLILGRVTGNEDAQYAFLDAWGTLVGPPAWRTIDIVWGGAHVGMTFAFSSLFPRPTERSGAGVVIELWDPFLCSLATTELLREQLRWEWGKDVDMLNGQIDFTLGAN